MTVPGGDGVGAGAFPLADHIVALGDQLCGDAGEKFSYSAQERAL
jgi:hypothetical protein